MWFNQILHSVVREEMRRFFKLVLSPGSKVTWLNSD